MFFLKNLYKIIYLYYNNIIILLSLIIIIISTPLIPVYNLYILEWLILITTLLNINFLGVVEFFKINIISTLWLLVSLIILFFKFNFYQISIFINFGNFMKLSSSNYVSLSFYIDYINYNFSLLTVFIAFSVYIYVYVYMRFELNLINFFFFLKSFVLSMILLLWAGNWVTLILGWELIGISSFLLINFWSNKITTLKSAFKAFTFNKISDCALILAFLLALNINGVFFFNFSTNINLFIYKYFYLFGVYINYIDFFLISVIICSFCKSAQFGFHFWLPDSMEAPVPASALIHSATLVSAGIYLLLRFNYLFLYSNWLYNVFLILTSFTAFFGAIVASFQTDVKKILAYSTISHCGFLMVSILSFNPTITLLYLFGHGFFKSLNFMCVGNLISYSNNYQDYRRMGGLYVYLVFEFFTLFICVLNLGSLPFFLNFFSKHFLLNYANLNSFIFNFITIILYFAAFFGIFYSIRLVYYTFLNFKKSHYYNFLIKSPINNTYLTLLFNSSKLNILAISLLFVFTLVILSLYMYTIFNSLTLINDVYSNIPFFTNFSLNSFFVKILFFYVYINILYIFFTFKQNNLYLFNYLWLYYFIIIIICI